MSAWLTRHVQTLVGSLGRLSQQGLATFFTVLVIGIALALPACLHLLIANAQSATGDWNRTLDLSVYLKRPTSVEEAQRTAERLRQRRDIEEVQVITAEEALKEFRRSSGFGAAIDALQENPLPHALVVRPRGDYATSAHLQTLTADIQELPSVDVVQLDTEWVNRLHAMLDAARRAALLTSVLLGMGVMFIVGNTIRLEIQNRRDEIEVTKLLGASNGFVRRPFLYCGFWYGLAGGIVAWILSAFTVAFLRDPVGKLAGLYASQFQIRGLGWQPTAILLGAGIGLAWFGSYLAASRHLRRIEPTEGLNFSSSNQYLVQRGQ